MDPHVHYSSKKSELASLFSAISNYPIECINLISDRNPGKQWIKDVEEFGQIGEKVIPYYMLDLTSGAADQVQQAYDLGFWGLKFIAPSFAYDDPIYIDILSRAQDLGMPCLFHTGVFGFTDYANKVGTGMSLMRADMLDTLAHRYPDLLIQGAHIGNPNVFEAIRAAQYSPNLKWDTCGGIRHILMADPIRLYAAMNHLPGAWDDIMWATDTATGYFKPEYAEGWPSFYEYMLASWQRILAGFPIKPTSDQLDKYFYLNARGWVDRVIEKRKK
jgi:predicted TIM-barrel fold metal-dependent hydrolase